MADHILLRHRDIPDLDQLEVYLEHGGFEALKQVVTGMTSQEVIDVVKASGLRGRGGAGFPTGLKWSFAAGNQGEVKYVVCNADEGDPGAFMDRSVLEGDPHSVLEGMIICARAIGASSGYIYCRAEYPLAIRRLTVALDAARRKGYLGADILGSGFGFDITIKQGAGAFVCGEETALIRSVEGYTGEPRQRPPYPIEKGIGGYPTCINNVETLANIPVIINNGADAYARIGVPGNTGTKIFSLVGKIENTGLVEVPMGVSLRDIAFKIGGGVPKKKKFKAVQTGGPSGGCLPAELLDLPVDFDSLTDAGSMMGSGGMIVMDQSTCMVDVARYFLSFLTDESCGKCVPCREGLW